MHVRTWRAATINLFLFIAWDPQMIIKLTIYRIVCIVTKSN